MQPADWINLVGTLVAAFAGAFAAYILSTYQERRRANDLQEALRRSLRAEVQHNAELANTYIDSGILSPAYRFEDAVFGASFSELIASGTVSPAGVRALLQFYSQIRQVNWCLNEIQRLRSISIDEAREEAHRLRAKLDEMKSPRSIFYDAAYSALN